jgi:predicted small integral membrane protein
MRELRLAKCVMTASLGVFALLVMFNNLTDYGSNFAFVQHVLSMDTTFPGNALMYRAITVPPLWHLGYWAIIAGEALTGVLFVAGAAILWRHRNACGADFDRAKRTVYLAGTVGFLIWFVGFTVVGGEWFAMWQSKTWNGQEVAFRISATILGVLIFVNQPDRDLA